MGLTIGKPAGNGSPDPRGHLRVESVHVQAQVHPCGSVERPVNGLVRDGGEAAAIHLFHGVDPHSQFRHHAGFSLVHASDSDQSDVLRVQPGRPRSESADLGKSIRAATEEGGHRHAVQVAARRRLRGVGVGVRIHPDEPQTLGPSAGPRCGVTASGHSGNRPDGHGMVASEDERQSPAPPDVPDPPGEVPEHPNHFVQVAGALLSRAGERLRHRRIEIPGVLYRMSESLQARGDPRPAHGRRPHVHPPATSPQIQRHTDQTDRFLLHGFILLRATPGEASAG